MYKVLIYKNGEIYAVFENLNRIQAMRELRTQKALFRNDKEMHVSMDY